MLLNLAINAFNSMPEGGRLSIRGLDRVTPVTGAEGRETGESIEIEVRDTGAGIAEIDVHRIFDAGFTGDAGNLGLGLAICRRTIEEHSGSIGVEAMRNGACDYGKIGEWIEKLGFASENEVTKALALQWGCAVATSFDPSANFFASGIPFPILEAFQMLPLNYVASSNTLYLAFGERVDHAALYAIEKILDCRTVPCVAGREGIARKLDSMRQLSRPSDVEFGPMRDLSEMARIASSYTARLSPAQVCLSRVGRFIWLRLDVNPNTRTHVGNLHHGVEQSSIQRSPRGMVQSKPHRITTNLVFRLPNDSPRTLLTRDFRDLYPVNPLQTR